MHKLVTNLCRQAEALKHTQLVPQQCVKWPALSQIRMEKEKHMKHQENLEHSGKLMAFLWI
jgi:hypothetical protein